MEELKSRKNPYIRRLRALCSDASARSEAGEFVCEGLITLRDALEAGAEIGSVLFKGKTAGISLPDSIPQYAASEELFDYVSPMKNCPGPLFTVAFPVLSPEGRIKNAIILENVQDPGNVGTVVRSANAFGVDLVVLVGECADAFGFRAVRASMGAIFKTALMRTEPAGLSALLRRHGLRLYGAALSSSSEDIRALSLSGAAVAVGNEGSGLSRELLALCDSTLIIPMSSSCESLNAGVAASLIMWEMARYRETEA